MTRTLIFYGTTDGHTAKIADTLGATLRVEGHAVDVIDAARAAPAPRPDDYDGVIVLASIHIGNFQRAVKRWVRHHATALNRRPSAFVSVCLAILEQRPEARQEVHEIVARFLEKSGWHPTATTAVAGAVPYTRYNWLKKWIMKRILTKTGGGTDTTRDYEYTDWDDVRAFGRDFAARVTAGQAVRAR